MSQRGELLTPSSDVSEKVRDFYDRHPYPPPIENLEKYQRHWQYERRRADFRLFWPDRAYREDQSILIAGCGTSQAAKHALRWPAAGVTGIDCSATSVCHTERLKKQYDLKNLQVFQLAIEQAGELGMSFDQVVCTGVLHHLADPEAGLAALRSVLKLGGAMQLMVYAPYGRTGIYMLQEFCRRVGIRADHEGIRDLNHALGALPPGHPLQTLLAQSPELRNEAALADALLHPQDRAYSVPQFLDLIEKAGLIFGRWMRQAPYSVHCGVITKIPKVGEIARLPLREQYAAIELFRGTMIRHTAIVYRDDCTSLQRFDCLEDDWLDYVPIRMPDTVCIQDRVPPPAAAVLVNRTHTYNDLFLTIGGTEKKVFDAIDGQRTIGDIAEKVLSSADRGTYLNTNNFFERLWWHDQVVFETN
ncbi:MAG TPA: class I SAM-dependent methyltransferase [Terriglobales bacterium]|nr:class I SAM-dependent methyltransferase [Terriglobales bacterium]